MEAIRIVRESAVGGKEEGREKGREGGREGGRKEGLYCKIT